MAANIILKTKYLVAGQPDGFCDADIVRTRRFRKTATNFGTVNEGDTFTSSDYLAAAKIPAGFIPSHVVVNVIKANASGDLTVYAAKSATAIATQTANNYDSSDLVSLATADLDAVGKTYKELLPTIAVASTVGTPTSTKWLAGNDDYLVLKADAAVDAEFEVLLVGDFVTLEA